MQVVHWSTISFTKWNAFFAEVHTMHHIYNIYIYIYYSGWDPTREWGLTTTTTIYEEAIDIANEETHSV